jgi:hypothetical protein
MGPRSGGPVVIGRHPSHLHLTWQSTCPLAGAHLPGQTNERSGHWGTLAPILCILLLPQSLSPMPAAAAAASSSSPFWMCGRCGRRAGRRGCRPGIAGGRAGGRRAGGMRARARRQVLSAALALQRRWSAQSRRRRAQHRPAGVLHNHPR